MNTTHKRRVLLIGTGDIALRIARAFGRQFRFYGLVRDASRAAALREQGIVPVSGDLDQRASLSRVAALADHVIFLAPPPDEGDVDPRIAAFLASVSRRRTRIVYVSTTGVYGDRQGAWVDETARVAPTSQRAQRRVNAERRLRAAGARGRARAAILRVPGIYASDRLPEARLRAHTPAIVPEEDSFSNHIHADDLTRACVLALTRARSQRVINVCDDTQLKMGDYFDRVADAVRLPRPPRLARSAVRDAVSPMVWSFMAESRRVRNTRMKRELRLRLRFENVEKGLLAISPPAGASD